MNSIILLSQAPGDIKHVLTLYEKYKADHLISIFVINIESNYQFLISLKLNVEKLEFIPNPGYDISIKRLWRVLRLRKYVNYYLHKHFEKITNSSVFFFARYFDLLSFSFVSYLSKRNQIYFVEHELVFGKRVTNLSFREKLSLLLYRYVSRANLSFHAIGGSDEYARSLSLEYQQYNNINLHDVMPYKETLKKFSHDVGPIAGTKSVLFFEVNEGFYYLNYEQVIDLVISRLIQRGYTVYIKPHPRIGCSPLLKKYNLSFIPSYIPGEFIKGQNFDIIIAVDSTALAEMAKSFQGNKTYSLMNLLCYKSDEDRKLKKESLISRSQGYVHFIHDVNDLFK